MTVLVHTDDKSGTGKSLVQALRRLPAFSDIQVARSLDELRSRLLHARAGIDAVVLHVFTVDQLRALMRLQTLLLDLRVVVVVPDWNDYTLTLVHNLHARFVTDGLAGFGDLAAVLRKMVRKADENNRCCESVCSDIPIA